MKKIHLIAIGGSAMHNMAISLHNQGHTVTGSDDQIFEPSKSRLKNKGILPGKIGWFPNKISKDIDLIILGMHAKIDNPELIRGKELNIPILSYPEYIYEHSKNKKRIVIAGSHGKTSITSMILHVLKEINLDCDYMVGAQLEGFETMVKLTNKAEIIILEGDEYLSSPIDRRPKFHLYKPDIAVISGIAWDHINVFPTFETYINQFRIFKNMINETLIYHIDDIHLQSIAKEHNNCKLIPYSTHKYSIKNGTTIINNTKLLIFGDHNLQNLIAARLVCLELGITNRQFYNKISTFKGASNRLELIKKTDISSIYKDFAHSPSKLKATCKAMKKQFPKKEIVACLELHTFSSLNQKFLKEYANTMNDPDIAIVYFNPDSIKHKNLDYINQEEIYKSFNRKDLLIFTNSIKLEKHLKSLNLRNKTILMMSSGNFNGINLKMLIED